MFQNIRKFTRTDMHMGLFNIKVNSIHAFLGNINTLCSDQMALFYHYISAMASAVAFLMKKRYESIVAAKYGPNARRKDK